MDARGKVRKTRLPSTVFRRNEKYGSVLSVFCSTRGCCSDGVRLLRLACLEGEEDLSQGKHIGRPFQLTAEQALEILARGERGESCRSIARQFSVSHTAVAKILKEGLSRCERMESATLVTVAEASSPQYALNTYRYAASLQRQLREKHAVELTSKECNDIVKTMLESEKAEEVEVDAPYYEYSRPCSYIKLTSHELNNDKQIRNRQSP